MPGAWIAAQPVPPSPGGGSGAGQTL